jgi:hypothetical protein
MIFRLGFFVIIYFLTGNVTQSQDPYHIVFDVNNGLPSSEVYDVELDKYNNLWFSTDRGVSCYNGYEFKNYTTNDGLTNNTVFEIFKDRQGNLWFSCYDGSVCYYDYQSFKPAPFNEELKQYIIRNWVRQIYFDSAGNCSFFLGKTTSYDSFFNYYKYYKASDSLAFIKPQTDMNFFKIGEKDHHDFYYIKEINYYTHITNEYESDKTLLGITPETNYIFCDESKKKLQYNDFNSNIYIIENDQARLIYDMPTQLVRTYIDKERNIWLMTDEGLQKLEDVNKLNQIKPYFKNYSCSGMIQDQENNFWITTINKGVILVPAMNIEEYQNDHFGNSKILDLEELDDFIIGSNFNGELYSINEKAEIDFIFGEKNRYLKLKKSKDHLYTYNNDRLIQSGYFITFEKNINPKREYSKCFLKVNESYFLKQFHSLLWCTLDENGVQRPMRDIYTDFRILEVFKDSEGIIWLGSLGGLYRIPEYQKDLYQYEEVFPNIDLGRISEFIELENKDMLIGTHGKGIFHYNRSSEKISPLNYSNKFDIPIINSLYLDDKDYLWIGTNKGLYKSQLKESNGDLNIEIEKYFDNTQGISSEFIYDILKWKDKIWLVSEKALNVFDPESIKENLSSPLIYFDSITTRSQSLKINEYYILENKDKNLSFYFTANSFKKNRNLEFYRYALVSSTDTLWNYTNNRSVQFTNLPPKQYSFIVEARNDVNNWSERPAVFNFKIKPHFTETGWFRILALISFMGLGYLLYWYRSKSIIRKEIQKRRLQFSEMRAQKAELDALRGQMNPHFIFNALNSIQNYIYKGDKEKANYYMTRLSKLLRNSLEMSKLELITVDEEVRFLTNYLELEKMRFKDKFNFEIHVVKNDKHLKLPSLLLQPIVENSIKHAFRNIKYKGHLIISIVRDNNKLRLSVRDNGIGLEEKKLDKTSSESKEKRGHKSLSLQIINERLALINMQYKTAEAVMKVQSPIEKSDNFEKGTEVVITLPVMN